MITSPHYSRGNSLNWGLWVVTSTRKVAAPARSPVSGHKTRVGVVLSSSIIPKSNILLLTWQPFRWRITDHRILIYNCRGGEISPFSPTFSWCGTFLSNSLLTREQTPDTAGGAFRTAHILQHNEAEWVQYHSYNTVLCEPDRDTRQVAKFPFLAELTETEEGRRKIYCAPLPFCVI